MISTCAATGTPIRVRITAQGMADLDPPPAVVSLRLPCPHTARETICACGHLFVDRPHALAWPRLHAEAVLLSVAEAAQLASALANAA
jgi:alkylmercury lyase